MTSNSVFTVKFALQRRIHSRVLPDIGDLTVRKVPFASMEMEPALIRRRFIHESLSTKSENREGFSSSCKFKYIVETMTR